MSKTISKTILLAGTVLLSLGSVALAADLPSKKSPAVSPVAVAPAFSWTGCYVGADVGGTFGRVSGFGGNTSGFDNAKANTRGFAVGGALGCNYQMGPFVVGGVADIWTSTSRGSAPLTGGEGFGRSVGVGAPAIGPAGFTARAKNNFAGDLSVRGGYAIDHTLLFVKAGVAFADYKYVVSNGFQTATGRSNRPGLLLGLGVEQAIDAHWSVKLEYDNVQYGKHNTQFYSNGTPVFVANVRDTENLVKLGLNYRF